MRSRADMRDHVTGHVGPAGAVRVVDEARDPRRGTQGASRSSVVGTGADGHHHRCDHREWYSGSDPPPSRTAPFPYVQRTSWHRPAAAGGEPADDRAAWGTGCPGTVSRAARVRQQAARLASAAPGLAAVFLLWQTAVDVHKFILARDMSLLTITVGLC